MSKKTSSAKRGKKTVSRAAKKVSRGTKAERAAKAKLTRQHNKAEKQRKAATRPSPATDIRTGLRVPPSGPVMREGVVLD